MTSSSRDETEPLVAPQDDKFPVATTPASPWSCRRPNLFFVEPVLILYFFSEFPVDIIAQKYVLDWITSNIVDVNGTMFNTTTANPCSSNSSQSDRDLQDRVQSLTSLFSVLESVVWGIPAIISTVILGAGSDSFGRRLAVLPPLFGVLMSSCVVHTVVRCQASIGWLFIGDLLYGCCGSFTAMTMSCFAFVADRTRPDRRMVRITLLEMCVLVAGVVSPIGLGSIINRIGNANTLLIIVTASLVNLIYVLIFLPGDSPRSHLTECDGKSEPRSESPLPRSDVPPSCDTDPYVIIVPSPSDEHVISNPTADDVQPRSEIAEPRYRSCCAAVAEGVRNASSLFFTKSPHRWQLVLLIVTFFISNLPTFDFSLATLFEMNRPLCWSINKIGIFSGVSLGIGTVGAMTATPLMKLCMSDLAIAIWAAFTAVATNIYKGFVYNSLMMYLSVTLSMFYMLLIPSIRSLMSQLVDDHQQGAVFGAIASVEVVCGVIGTVVFNSIYSNTLDIASGFVFLVMAIFYAIGCICLVFYAVRLKQLKGRQHQQLLADSLTVNN